MHPVFTNILVQLLLTLSDVIGRHLVITAGFSFQSFASGWFLFYISFVTLQCPGKLYVLSKIELGHTVTFFGVVSIMLAN